MNGRCARTGCTNIPTVCPVLVFRAPEIYEPCEAIRCVMDIIICDEHALDTAPDHYLTDAGFKRVCEITLKARQPVPDRARTLIEFVPMESDEAQSARRALRRLRH